ncbi:7845_t:CDS:2 [Funneliformis geosporum]|uniref:3967_t:CDS:1 n=1 Tax=Funneliformis geosporum TaxID=1117311 RepID=A0A9W4SG20_9GLOM|nr:7845_t:CDS:2 [Funneliformis geosporum]CAI2165796.1 3967_t:CDS:2 [Funneliformis geosporum]
MFFLIKPSFVTSVSETSSPINGVVVDDLSLTNAPSTTEVKKIVLLKRNPNINNNTINNNNMNSSPTNNAGSSNVVQSYELLLPNPNRSETSSPSLDMELTPEQAAHLGEIDFNTGLDGFLLAALKNPKDRLFLLKLDREMERFIKEKNRTRLEFPPMNSYQRLIVHRVAQYFKLSHVVDTSGKAVVLYKSAETQMPILRFSDLLEQEEEKPEKSVKIMRRQQSYPQGQLRSGDSDSNSEGERKLLTIEEREAAYQKARARIFKDLEQKNGENEQEDTDGSINSSPSVKSSNIPTSNDNQNSDSSSSNKSKGNQQQQNGKGGNNNKGGKQSQQANKAAGNNKNSNNKNNGSNAKNRQHHPARPHLPNHYMNIPTEWNPTLGHYTRPGVRNLWGTDSFNGPQEMSGSPSLFNHQQNNPNPFLPPRTTPQSDTNFVQNQTQNNLKHMNQFPQNPYAHPPYTEGNHVMAVSSGDGNSNKSSVREGNEGINENKMNDRQLEQKRPNNRNSVNHQSQQRDGPFFNPVWNNSSDSQTNVFNQSQTSNEFPVQNAPGMSMMPSHIYPGMIPPPMTGQPMGPRRNNNGNQIFPGPVPQDYMQRMGIAPPPIMGFPPQPTQPNMTTTGAIRPPKSSELFDPNNSNNLPTSTALNTAPYNKVPVTSLPVNNTSQILSIPPTNILSLPSRPTHPILSSKNTNDNSNSNASNNSVVDGTMMRSLSLSSNSNGNHNKKNKDGPLLFDYSMQVPYEGVKPSEANEPQKPNHILELYDFGESDDLMNITLTNAIIKRVSPPSTSPSKRPTILAIFKNAREANKAVQTFRGVRFKIKTWEPLVKTNVINNGGSPTSTGQISTSINLTPSKK